MTKDSQNLVKGQNRSRRMQGFPLEGYKSLPTNSPKDTCHEEVENHSYAGSVTTPLLANPERALVMVEEGTLTFNPNLQVPFNPLLVRLDSSGNVIVESYPHLLSSPSNHLDMEPIKPNFSEE
jgi:hypothetical protein